MIDSSDSKPDSVKTGYIFKNLSIENPNLILNNNTLVKSCNINVVFKDELTLNKKAAIFFTDGGIINANGLSGFVDSIANINVYLTDNKPVTGKLIALIYTVDQFQQILSYDYFGYKDSFVVSAGNNISETFRQDEMTYNPPEAVVSGSITNLPPNSTLNPFFYYISFSSRAPAGYLGFMIMSSLSGNTFNLKVPSQLPVSYYPVIGAYIMNSSNTIFGKINFVLPVTNQTGLQYYMISGASLLSPPNTTTGFNPNNNLQWNSPDYGVIYCLNVQYADGNKVYNYFVYTDNGSFTLNELSKFNFQTLNDKTFNWSVSTLSVFYSMNEFVYPAYPNLQRAEYNMLNKWSFTTSPVK